MKLLNIVIVMGLLSVFIVSADYEISSYKKLHDKSMECREKVDSFSFIFESFRRTCEGQGFSSFNEWQKVCRTMWKLDYIGWARADSFMEVEESEKGTLFYGTWVGPAGNGEVYCRMKE